MRRRLPSAKYKPSSASQKAWINSQTGLEQIPTDGNISNHSSHHHQAFSSPGTAEYLKAVMAAQNVNFTDLGTQRNLGELAMLAGIKQRLEQHPQDVSDLERHQYLTQCTSEEQRQALMASGAFGNDATAMAALAAFYSQLGVDMMGNNVTSGKRSMLTEYNTSQLPSGQEDTFTSHLIGDITDSSSHSKRQRRISQAEVEKRLKEAEHINNQNSSVVSSETSTKSHHHQLSIGVSDSNRTLVKREPMSPSGTESNNSKSSHVTAKDNHQLTVPTPMSMFPAAAAHEHSAYWESQAAAANMALIGAASMAHSCVSTPAVATSAHSQSHIQHLQGHEVSSADMGASEVPMNLAYHDADKTQHTSPSLPSDPLPDTASLAAQVEVTTSQIKSTSRRRASSSPRSSQHADASLTSRDQVSVITYMFILKTEKA